MQIVKTFGFLSTTLPSLIEKAGLDLSQTNFIILLTFLH